MPKYFKFTVKQFFTNLKNRFFSNLKHFLAFFLVPELFYVLFTSLSTLYHKYYDVLLQLKYVFIALSYLLLFVFAYLLYAFTVKIYRGRRVDILFSSSVGILLFFSLHIESINNINFNFLILNLLGYKWALITGLFIIIFIVIHLILQNKTNKPIFLSDDALKDSSEDRLGYQKDAEVFAQQVLNNMAKDSIVFGLDAPWGTGKSSYLNLCKSYWQSKTDVILLDFEPLRFEDNTDLFKNFIQELTIAINRKNFVPEIQSTFYKYIKSILQDVKFGFGYISFGLFNTNDVESNFNTLRDELRISEKKIVIIIDDLDRLPISYVKTILDIVKKSFTLPNLTYVLCYDTEALSSIDYSLKITESVSNKKIDQKEETTKSVWREKIDNQKLIEYLEKIVNVKKTIVIPRSKIRNFLVDNLKTINSNQTLDIFSESSLEKIILAVDYIFLPTNYHRYMKYLGDLRKIKRFLNIFKMQVAYNLDFVRNLSKIDIDFLDLIHLILIYINYPKTFRKIYNTETDGGKEFFSLALEFNGASGHFEYQNSSEYHSYLENSTDDEIFLISQIFDSKKFHKEGKDSEYRKSTSAAFNGDLISHARNLEDYIKAITDRVIPEVKNSYTVHQTNGHAFISNQITIDDLFKDSIYVMSKENNGEKYRSLFYRILINNIDKLNYDKSKELINFMINDIGSYSIIDQNFLDLGLRKATSLDILYILNKKGWKDADGQSFNNTNENVSTIAKYIFGEDEFKNSGILHRLLKDETGSTNILKLIDTLHFRLYCNQDRGGEMYNLYTALQFHNNPAAKNAGLVRDLLIEEMQEMTQKIFLVIKEEYILKKRNIFKEIEELNQKDIFSKSLDYVLSEEKNESHIKEIIGKEKSLLKIFTTYQISSNAIDNGVGMGFYDEEGGNNGGGIRQCFLDYLYAVCFNAENPENIGYFIDFLLTDLKTKRNIRSDLSKYVPDLNHYDRILDKNRLLLYWKENREKISDYVNKNLGKKLIFTYNYTANYEDAKEILDLFDKETSKLLTQSE